MCVSRGWGGGHCHRLTDELCYVSDTGGKESRDLRKQDRRYNYIPVRQYKTRKRKLGIIIHCLIPLGNYGYLSFNYATERRQNIE